MNKWIAHIKSWAAKNNMNYRDALKSPACKKAYKK